MNTRKRKPYVRKTSTAPTDPTTWPARITKTRRRFIDAVIRAGLAEAPTLTRVQLLDILAKNPTISHPYWLTDFFKESWGVYTNPVRFTTSENINLELPR